jgi:hypothetical protein
MNYRNLRSMILPVALVFLIASSPASAQAQKQDPDLERLSTIGVPDVRITRVTNRGVATDDSVQSIRVEWNAEARQITTFLGFTASVEVEYADGSKNSNSRSVEARARHADIGVPNKGGNAPRRFIARLRTEFKVFHSLFINVTEEFDLNKANGFNADKNVEFSPGHSSEPFAISRVRLTVSNCASGKHCFIVNWGTAPPRPGLQLVEVSLNAVMTYNNNEARSAALSASPSARTATLVCDETKAGFTGVKFKLTTKVSANVSNITHTQLSGSF